MTFEYVFCKSPIFNYRKNNYFLGLIILLSSIGNSAIAGGGVVPDGATATKVTTSSSGVQTVTIAPSVSGVSNNTYSQFNVGSAGVVLNNVGINARNIVNQVTSTNPSLIEGNITVAGPRANIILANPNGITVNGSQIFNAGNVALTTAQVSFYDFIPTPGVTQRNILLDTNQGQITIGPNGLSGAMLNLELIAKTLNVNGAVQNTFSTSAEVIRAVIGNSHAAIDSSISPTDNISSWINYTNPSTSNNNLAIDITPLGSLTAGKVELVVTDQGAGVHMAGTGYANAGNFVLSSTGAVVVNGGQLQASGTIDVTSNSFSSTSASTSNTSAASTQTQITAGQHVIIAANAVNLVKTTVTGGTKTTNTDGSVTVNQVGNIILGNSNTNAIAAGSLNSSTLTATGGIGLSNVGQDLQITNSTLQAQQNIVIATQTATIASGWVGTSSTTVPTSIISNTGSISLNATSDVQVNGAKLNGVGGLTVQSNNLTLTTLHQAGQTQQSTLESGGGNVTVTAQGAVNITGSNVLALGNINLQAAGLNVQNDGALSSTIVSTNASVVIHSSAAITNESSLIEGCISNATCLTHQGTVSLSATGNILNETQNGGPLAVIFASQNNVAMQAGGNITNHYGRIISNEAVALTAAGDINNQTDHVAGSNNQQAQYYSSDATRWLVLTKQSSGMNVDYGTLARPGELSFLIAGTDMQLQANNINNVGSVILTSGNLTANATQQFINSASFSGQASINTTCLIFCKSHASSTVQSSGGLISATQNIQIKAGQQASNTGGVVSAGNNLTVTAPTVLAKGVIGYAAYNQPNDMKAWFGSSWSQLYASDVGGSWGASLGKVVINGQGVIDGGIFNGASVSASGGITIVSAPINEAIVIENDLGLMSWIWK